MKFIIYALLLAVSPYALSWEKITPEIHAIYGERVGNSNQFSDIVELVYNKEIETFGISFIDNKGKRETVDYAIFDMKNCKHSTHGAIAGSMIIDVPSKDRLNKILLNCNQPILLKVSKSGEDYVTYKFGDVGVITEK